MVGESYIFITCKYITNIKYFCRVSIYVDSLDRGLEEEIMTFLYIYLKLFINLQYLELMGKSSLDTNKARILKVCTNRFEKFTPVVLQFLLSFSFCRVYFISLHNLLLSLSPTYSILYFDWFFFLNVCPFTSCRTGIFGLWISGMQLKQNSFVVVHIL